MTGLCWVATIVTMNEAIWVSVSRVSPTTSARLRLRQVQPGVARIKAARTERPTTTHIRAAQCVNRARSRTTARGRPSAGAGRRWRGPWPGAPILG